MPMKNPPHPGRHVRVNCVEAAGLTVTEAAKMLCVNRNTLSNLLNEKGGISAEMAVRLEKVGWGSADSWMSLQMNYDLAKVRAREDDITVRALADML